MFSVLEPRFKSLLLFFAFFGLALIPLCFSIFSISAPPAFAAADEEICTIIRVFVNDQKDREYISSLGFDLAETRRDSAVVILPRSKLDLITARDLKYKVLYKNADDVLKPWKEKQTADGNIGKYHSYDNVVKILKTAAADHPEIAKALVIGKSCEGRDIYALKISGSATKSESETGNKIPHVLIMGLHHAREWISVEIPLTIIDRLLKGYGQDPSIKKLVDERVIYFVPVVNPDGLTYSQTSSKMWRKNRRVNANTSQRGVDPNRNYSYKWGNVGASDYAGSDTYHGTGPFSEPETSAIRSLAKEQKFVASISFHSYSELVLYPFGYDYNIPCPDHDLLAKLAEGMSKFNGYTPENSADLYPAMGDSDDWLYGEMGCLSFTIELGSQFIPPDSQVDSICKKNTDAAMYLIEKAASVSASNYPGRPVEMKSLLSRLDFMNRQLLEDEYLSTVNRGRADSKYSMLVDSRSVCFDELIAKLEKGDVSEVSAFASHLASLSPKSRELYMPTLSKFRNRLTEKILSGRRDNLRVAELLDLTQRLNILNGVK